MTRAHWGERPGLAGGIDKDGSRAAELLGAGFASVEFGTVTARPVPGANPGVAALAARLRALAPRGPGAARIGIGIGATGLDIDGGNAGAGLAPQALATALAKALATEWPRALELAWGAADYLSFNLSARAYQALLAPEHLPALLRALHAVTAARERLGASGRRVSLALKLPLATDGDFSLRLASAAADAGFDMLTAVLPESDCRLRRLELLASRLPAHTTVLAVGGVRTGADVRAAMAAGAHGVQVHRVFAQLGAACLPMLLAPASMSGDKMNGRA